MDPMRPHPLHVSTWGEGPDVVFLHGLGASSRYWENFAAVSNGYRATAPDLLGFGRSPAPPDSAYDVDAHLAALLPVLPDEAVVVAHSTGAILAAALAVRHPARVRSLLLLGLPAYPDEHAALVCVAGLGLLAKLTVEGRPSARWLCESMCRARPIAIALAPFVIRDLPPSIASDAARHTWVSYSRTLRRVVVEHRAVDDLLAAGAPVRLLHGEQDRGAPAKFVAELGERAQLAGRAIAVDFVEGDHHLAVRRPDVVADALNIRRA